MSHTPDEISQAILATLATTAPGLSCELGTPERKIIDAAAEAISEAYVDQYIVGSLLDIDTKSGLELEQFVGIFGFGRLQGRQATGVVRVELTTVSQQDFNIQQGTQFYTQPGVSGNATPLYYAATQNVVLVAGTYSCDVPVQCTIVGVAGNVPPDSITYLGSVIGASSCTNLTAMTGGVDIETDDELRQRFKDTLLRNISGTSDWYINLCLQNTNVNRATVYGPITTYRTQIEAPSTTLTLDQYLDTTDVKYVWPQMESVFINLGTANEVFYTAGDDYTLSSGISPVFYRVGTGQINTGDILDLEFEYTTNCSRNDPENSITNKVDVFVDGVDPFTIQEKTVVSDTTLSSESTDPLYVGNFERVGSPGEPSATNRFMRLGSVPIVSFPSTITVGTTVYTLGTHYYQLQDTTLMAGSKFETSGIEWESFGAPDGTELTLQYVYNRVPELLTAVINTSKQICTDVMIHQANYQYIQPCLSIEYDRSYDPSQVNASINTQLQQYFQQQGFGAWILISNMCLAVQQVLGVVNVYLTPQEDPISGTANANYGVQVFNNSADSTTTPPSFAAGSPYTDDFKLPDNVLPQFLQAITLRRATR
jgi:uncharacterized phage protein gp47/JayE